MPDICHQFQIKAPISDVCGAISTPEGLDSWWTLSSEGKPAVGEAYRFFFSKQFDWKAEVVRCSENELIEWRFSDAEPDWTGTRLVISLSEKEGLTWIDFRHLEWKSAGDHYRHTSFCWAMYLRLLKRYVERGEVVAYEARNEA